MVAGRCSLPSVVTRVFHLCSSVFICGSLLFFGSRAEAACGGPYNDILAPSDALLAPVQPPDCATVLQSPPDFTWPPQNGDNNTYTVTLFAPDGRSEQRSTTRNFLIWPRVLPAGPYRWTVTVSGRDTGESAARTFTVDPAAVPFVVPTGEEALERARKTPRPRSWSRDAGSPLAALKSERAKGFAELLDQVEKARRQPLPPQPASKSKDENYELVITEVKRTLAASFAWAGGRQPAHGAEAARRLMNLASWNPRGPVGYAANDMAGRSIAWALALGYDWAHDFLNPFQKAVIAAAIKAHSRTMFDDLAKFSRYPYDSHGNVTLTIAAAIAALMAGDLPEADGWLRSNASMAIVWTSPWGWQDGGFGNGTAQMFWDTQSNLLAWYVYRSALGVDLAKKPWVRNLGRAMAYFVPPGTPAGNFGDGQELNLQEVWARVAKAYASFAPSPLARWYAREMKGEDPSRLELLAAPKVEIGQGGFPANTEHAAVFPSVGWVAMHSDLADPMRTSIYFKSSPYGSYNHSHSDQNSFIVNDRGKRLLIASGHYDGYRTPHWMDWYKQSRSTNAITFDGGHGQGFNDRRFAGAITRFGHTPEFDHAVGRAEKAYGGALTLAQRSLAYLRPGTLVVYDALASATPRTWEWNLHAVKPMTPHGKGRVAIANGDAALCVELLASPPVEFAQADQFSAPPQDRSLPNEWHGAFASTQNSLAAEFVALVRIGADCTRHPARSLRRRTVDGA
jgi:hypothetical protein